MFKANSREFNLAISSVLEAGKVVREIYNTSFEVTYKSKDDPLTQADLQANKIIIDQIKATFPEDGILSEEIADNPDRLSKDRVWILDPIDGTREFVQKNPEFSISLGLSYKNKAVLGVVFNPITRELVSGIVGLGISYRILDENFKNDLDSIQLKPIEFKEEIAKPTATVSRSEFFKHKLYSSNPYWEEAFSLKPIGSIAYKLALTAVNKIDLSISLKPKNEWDICAGIALIMAAGGLAVDIENLSDFSFNAAIPLKRGIIAGNPNLVRNLLDTKADFLKSSLVDWN